MDRLRLRWKISGSVLWNCLINKEVFNASTYNAEFARSLDPRKVGRLNYSVDFKNNYKSDDCIKPMKPQTVSNYDISKFSVVLLSISLF